MFPCELAREALRLACLPRAQPAAGEGEGEEEEEEDEDYGGTEYGDEEDGDEDAEEDLDAYGATSRFALAGGGGDGDGGDLAGAPR